MTVKRGKGRTAHTKRTMRKGRKGSKAKKTMKRSQRGSGCGCSGGSGSGSSAGGSGSNWRNVDIDGPQKGGSPQSELVMNDSMQSGVLTDYINSPRIRQPGYSDGFDSPMCQGGGSMASDMVMNNLPNNATTSQYQPEPKVIGDINSLKLYQTTGGARRSRRSKRSSKRSTSSKHKSKSSTQRGGGSDWIMSNYSQGSINAPAQPGSWTGQFGTSQPSSRDMLMNPPTLGLAGSGSPIGSLEGANVRMIGSPL